MWTVNDLPTCKWTKKKRIRSPESLFCPPHSSSLVFLLRLGYCRAHPIPTLNKFSSIVTGNLCPFQVFDDVCSQFDVFLALDLAPWKESKTPENNQIVKVSSTKNKKLLHYNKKLLLHIPTYLSYIQKMKKNTNSSVSSPRGKKYLSQVLLAYRPLN